MGDGFWCVVAQRCRDVWDWIDKRDIDKHVASWAVFYATWHIVTEIIKYIQANPAKSGVEIGAIVAALMVPWSSLQGFALKWYFEARS